MTTDTINNKNVISIPWWAHVLVIAAALFVAKQYTNSDMLWYSAGRALGQTLMIYLLARFLIEPLKPYINVIPTVTFSALLLVQVYIDHLDTENAKTWFRNATPLIQKLNLGGNVTDEDIKAAKTGEFENFLIVSAQSQREYLTLFSGYQNNLNKLGVENYLAAETLGTEKGRVEFKKNLDGAQILIKEFEKDFLQIFESAKNEYTLAAQKTNDKVARSMMSGLEKSYLKKKESIISYIESEKLILKTFLKLSDHVNKSKPRIDVSGNIFFENKSDELEYKNILIELNSIGKKQNENSAAAVEKQKKQWEETQQLLNSN